MTKAEQKRWSIWTNAMCVLTLLKKFYGSSCIQLTTMWNTIKITITMFTGTYELEELVNDLDQYAITDVEATTSQSEDGAVTTITIEWNLENHDC